MGVLSRIKEEINSLRNVINKDFEEVRALRISNNELKLDIGVLKRRVDSLVERESTLEKGNDELKKQVEGFKNRITTLEFSVKNPMKFKVGDKVGNLVVTGARVEKRMPFSPRFLSEMFMNIDQPMDELVNKYYVTNTQSGLTDVFVESKMIEIEKNSKAKNPPKK